MKLNVDQVNVVLTALGEMPAKSGAGMIMNEIINQVKPQIPEETESTESTEE